ncbi:signal peptidase I [Bifidobacterium panos]|uniref:Signal peptidase I n=1 Tax=Bifidobacterium panos TaxID=2675321 RepID=A0ABX1T0B7_9BIFI|nr:signal peptidase I [Bifidobacterium sp. DSM 109963]
MSDSHDEPSMPQSSPRQLIVEDRDSYTLAVADHGVDPAPLPTSAAKGNQVPRHAKPVDPGTFTWRDFVLWCGVPVVVMLLVRILLIGCYTIPSGSMLDTIQIGDRVAASKLTPRFFSLKRGDVVVFHDPANWLGGESSSSSKGDYLIKRLIGLPGDVVECAGAGQPITINGVAVDESAYLKSDVQPSSFAFKVTVTAGHVFVMGDNRSNSADSRYHQDDGQHGLVPVSDIVGVAIFRYWPLNRIGLLDSHHEVFDNVPDGNAS